MEMDETYIKIKGNGIIFCRAIDAGRFNLRYLVTKETGYASSYALNDP